MKEIVGICRPLAIYKDIFYNNWVIRKSQRISWCKVSRLIIVTIQRKGKRRTVACTEAVSYS